MKKILFLIHDLGVGGAEKVLVNLVNHMDSEKFDITVLSLFGGGVNEQFLLPHIHYKSIWKKALPGNSRMMKLLSPKMIHKICVKDNYDIEVAFLESVISRIISGCDKKGTDLYSWIHIEQKGNNHGTSSFRGYKEAVRCYSRFKQVVCVSESVKQCFMHNFPPVKEPIVLYNVLESEKIKEMAEEAVPDGLFAEDEIKIVGVGKIAKQKGFDRLARITIKLLKEGHPVHLYLLGCGDMEKSIVTSFEESGFKDKCTMLGYQTNPYKYMKKCDIFVCSSFAEGFSTAASEALILGIPVCTVKVAGMEEMLGRQNEWGIVTDNNEEALFEGIKSLIINPDLLNHYGSKAQERGQFFSTDLRVKAVEELLLRS